MEALSLDLRERVCVACDEQGQTRQEIADRFGVSRSFVQKLLRRRREAGSIAAKPRGGGAKPLLGPHDHSRLRKLVKDKSDSTLAELRRGLIKSGGPAVSLSTLCRALAALDLRLKKRRCMRQNAIRPACVPCAGTGRSAWRRWTRRSWFSWTRAGSTRR